LKLSVKEFPLGRLREASLADVRSLLDALGKAPSPQFLFHLPFCGSTLLSHFLVEADWCVLRDPAVLAAAFQREDGKPLHMDDAEHLRALVTGLLAQCFGARPKVVRTAGYYPAMISRVRAHCPDARMLFVFADPEFFLLQILKDQARRADMRMLSGNGGAGLSDADCAIDFWMKAARHALQVEGGIGTVDAAKLLTLHAPAFDAIQAWLGGAPADVETALRKLSRHAKTGGIFDLKVEEARLHAEGKREHEQLAAAMRRFEAGGGYALLASLHDRSIDPAA
jgi:hypothetical protein